MKLDLEVSANEIDVVVGVLLKRQDSKPLMVHVRGLALRARTSMTVSHRDGNIPAVATIVARRARREGGRERSFQWKGEHINGRSERVGDYTLIRPDLAQNGMTAIERAGVGRWMSIS
jgi:hypothetical protein